MAEQCLNLKWCDAALRANATLGEEKRGRRVTAGRSSRWDGNSEIAAQNETGR